MGARALLEEALARAIRVQGSHGIVGSCRQRPVVAGLPEVVLTVAQGPLRDHCGRRFSPPLIGTGVSDDAAHSRLAAVVEAVERYSTVTAPNAGELVRATTEGVGDRGVPFEAFGLLPVRRGGYAPSVAGEPGVVLEPGGMGHGPAGSAFDWAWAWSLTRRCGVLVPAVLAHSSLSRRPPNDFAAGLTTTGVAAHVDVGAAVLAALFEVIERDALMLTWLARRSPPRLDLDVAGSGPVDPADDGVPAGDSRAPGRAARIGAAQEEALRALIRDRFRVPDIEFILLDITADSGVTTVACLALGDGPARPSVALGAACRLDPAAAARKALFEAAQTLIGCHAMGWDATSVVEPGEVRTLEDRARFYAGSGGRECAAFLAASPVRVSLADLGPASPGAAVTGEQTGDLDAVVERLRRLGLEVLVVDLTPPDVAAAGFRTVRVLVPGMVDIGADARFPALGSPRVHEVPARLGWPALGDAGLNLAPCPLS